MKKLSTSKSALAGLTTLATAMNLLGVAPAFANTYGPNPAATEPSITIAGSTTSYGATSGFVHNPTSQTSLRLSAPPTVICTPKVRSCIRMRMASHRSR